MPAITDDNQIRVDFGFLAPMYQALDGDDPRFSSLDEGWADDDPEQIDPFKNMLGADVLARARASEPERRTDPSTHVLPNDPHEGRRQADVNASRRGVNPGRTDGGVGHGIDLARTQLGTPYVFGAENPGTAFDCSGFVDWWANRTFGVDLPHSAREQMATLPSVSRDQLQAGDLIFYSYGRLGGAADHVEIYMGNGKQIGTSNPSEDLDIDSVDWDNVIGFGRVGGKAQPAAASAGSAVGAPGKMQTKKIRKPIPRDQAAAPAALSGQYGDAAFSTVLAEILGPDEYTVTKYKMPKAQGYQGAGGTVKRQLYRGFMDAGRPDLAQMVNTRAFNAWIQQESGWNVGVTSAANNNGLANDGLFQVWRGHSFNSRGQVSSMSPYEQAQIVAKYFGHLTPDDIRRYAQEIANGTYHGWG